VAVGSSASTVKVQSSWFCSKRRRKLEVPGVRTTAKPTADRPDDLLLLRDAIAAHTLARIVDLAQDILCDDVACSDDAHSNPDRCTITAKPAPCGAEHGGLRCNCTGGYRSSFVVFSS